MKKYILILLLFSLLGVRCSNLPPNCADTDVARIDFSLYDAVTRQDYFGKIGTNKILPNEINLYQEGFKPFLLQNCLTCNPSYGGYPWNDRYIRAGYVSNSIEIPYVERSADTKDSVGRQVNRTFYLKIKQDIDTIKINYFMDNACNMGIKSMEILYNDVVYYKDNKGGYHQINIYKK